jgi:hypothetical protein
MTFFILVSNNKICKDWFFLEWEIEKQQLLKETVSSFNNIFGWKYLFADDVFGTADSSPIRAVEASGPVLRRAIR